MKYCPNCGAEVLAGGKHCPACGASLSLSDYEDVPAKRVPNNRGLHIAIACVAALCVLTVGLWILWPHLSSGSIAPARGGSSSGRTPASFSTPVPTEAPATHAPVSQAVDLQPGTWWYGTMYLYNYVGSDAPAAESQEVWGYLGQDNDGRWFFEVYENKEHGADVPSYLSFYVEVYEDRLVPVIGNRDAWVFDLYLTAQDESRLSILLNDEAMEDSWYLELSYPYQTDEESFDLMILMLSE